MIVTYSQYAKKQSLSFKEQASGAGTLINPIKELKSAPPGHFLPGRLVTHHPQAGINPLVDAASYLFSIIGKLRQLTHYRHLNQLQQELIQEINTFLATIKHHGYNTEFVIVCRYIFCATLDDVIANTAWGGQGQWDNYRLLAAFNQDSQHHDKLFTIIERATNDPALYIDLMELMYICLSLGYKGQYRATEHNQYQLEQITHFLYKHIQAYRGTISKTLSPAPLKQVKKTRQSTSYFSQIIFIFITTACIILSLFVSLGYLTDVISNEVYKNIAKIETMAFNRA